MYTRSGAYCATTNAEAEPDLPAGRLAAATRQALKVRLGRGDYPTTTPDFESAFAEQHPRVLFRLVVVFPDPNARRLR